MTVRITCITRGTCVHLSMSIRVHVHVQTCSCSCVQTLWRRRNHTVGAGASENKTSENGGIQVQYTVYFSKYGPIMNTGHYSHAYLLMKA